jgi:long-chain acyl-CoA synthetase
MGADAASERIALVFEEREYSAAQLAALAAGLAGTLARRGVRAGDRVALMSSNRPEFVIAVQAIWRLGAAVVLFSPAWKQAEVEHAIAITQPSYAVGDHPVLVGRQLAGKQLPGKQLPMLHLDEPIEPAPSASMPDHDPDPSTDAVLVFSSGTTGLPKAVRHTHGSLRAAIRHWQDALELTAADRMQIATPPSHILGLLNIVTALETGIWLRLHRRFDLDALLECIAADRITVEMAVAPIALALAAHPKLESYDLSSLRYIMWGATPVTPSVAETVTRRTGVAWVPAYGASELPVIACNPIRGARLDTAGHPVPGVDMRVMTLEKGEPAAPGETGEIEVRGESLMAGYLPAEATAEALHDGWYRTGDVGHLDAEGWVRITDRCKEMIKVRGFQVAPAEVEGVLLSHPAVADCGVFGIPDPADGEAVIAAVAARGPASRASTGSPASPAEMIAFVGERLASYKRPSRIVLVDEIPRLPSGKLLRRVLKDRVLKDRVLEEQHGRPADG